MKKNNTRLNRLLLALLFAVLVIAGCTNSHLFTTPGWLYGDGISYPLRDRIVDDLMENHKLKGLTYKQLLHLLSTPQGSDSTSFYYEIINTYNYKGEHTYYKNLVFYMGKDSIIKGFKIVEYTMKKKK